MTTALSHDLEIRPPRPGDAGAMAKLMVRGNSTYGAWAPRFWIPPAFERTQAQWNLRLRETERWTRLVFDAEQNLVALASWRPAREHGDEGAPVPDVSYVSHLYVEPSRWGKGIASGVMTLAEAAMREAGYERAILWTPEDAPARRFYERCGWRPDAREQWSTELHLPMIGYEKHL